ncbi:hypothetical protein HAX54_008048 [Datura stramonium]|uniref:Uncharacterized protein n=1 Tax=Datura stramonium TaxID=4076 RepID=A0ABS8TF37_DATST|nr:hypothetical protein [Datura stramonium]
MRSSKKTRQSKAKDDASTSKSIEVPDDEFECPREALAAKNVEIKNLGITHHDAITMLHGKYAIEKEDRKAQIAPLQVELDKENTTNLASLEDIYQFLKQTRPSSSTPLVNSHV